MDASSQREKSPTGRRASREERWEGAMEAARQDDLMAEAGERQPLLSKGEVADDHQLLQLSGYVNANSGWYLFGLNFALCLGTILAVSGPIFYVYHTYRQILPRCYLQNTQFQVVLCNYTSLSYFTFPLFCPAVAIIVIYRRILEIRFYYECLLNSIAVHIESNIMTSPIFWTLIVYFVSACGVLFYATEDMDSKAKSAYFLPILTFFVFVYSKWDINSYLIPLPLYCSTNPRLASQCLTQATSTFVPQDQMKVAFENVNDELESRKGPLATLSTAEFFGLLRSAGQKEMAMFPEKVPDPPGFLAKVLGCCGLLNRPEYFVRFPQVSRPEVLGICFGFFKGYWVRRILCNKYLQDARSTSFRRWFYGFLVFAVFEGLLLILAYSYALSIFLVYEELLSPTSTAAKVLGMGRVVHEKNVQKLE